MLKTSQSYHLISNGVRTAADKLKADKKCKWFALVFAGSQSSAKWLKLLILQSCIWKRIRIKTSQTEIRLGK